MSTPADATKGWGLPRMGMVCALGSDPEAILDALTSTSEESLRPFFLRTRGESVLAGRVSMELPPLTGELSEFDCRNHRLAAMAYGQIDDGVREAISRFGADRVGVVVGSSTSGLDATEQGHARWLETGVFPPELGSPHQNAMGSSSELIARLSDARGIRYTVSTACTSGAKALASAADLIESGRLDAVITGGVDTLCEMTLNGFAALGALSASRARPMARDRDGLNIGEGAAIFLMTRESAPIRLIGFGESSDAYHMSAPRPDASGALASMRAALTRGGLDPGDIDYVNLHGTGTIQNDRMESDAVSSLLGEVACSSTKPRLGHCLGAAGAIEFGVSWLVARRALDRGSAPLPIHAVDGELDPELAPLRLVRQPVSVAGRVPIRILSNSFAFGGNNCTLILESSPDGHEAGTMTTREADRPTPRAKVVSAPVVSVRLLGVAAWAPALPDEVSWRNWFRGASLGPESPRPALSFVSSLARRRFSLGAAMMTEVAVRSCLDSEIDASDVNLVYGSANGEIRTMASLFDSLNRGEPLSPTAFGTSIHSSPAGQFDVISGHRGVTRALSCYEDTFACAYLDGEALLRVRPERPTLVVISEEAPPEPFDAFLPTPPFPYAIAVLLGADDRGVPIRARLNPKDRDVNIPSGEPSGFSFLRWWWLGEAELRRPTRFGSMEWCR